MLGIPDIYSRRRDRFWGECFLLLLCALLVGYALTGKGLAYLRIGPVYVGEVVMGLGLLAMILASGWLRVFRLWSAAFLLGFVVLGSVRTIWDLPDHGLVALRDAVIWAYGLFALIVAGLVVAQPSRLALLLGRFAIFARWYPLVILPLWMVQLLAHQSLPRTPGTNLPIIYQKGGDIVVHAVGTFAFVAVGLVPVIGWLYITALVVLAGLMTVGRAALLSLIAGVSVVGLLWPRSRPLRITIAAAAAAVILLVASNLTIRIPSVARDISFAQVTENLASLLGRSAAGNLEGTREWRLAWWLAILRDTLEGPAFWYGQGFGVNLADKYGFEVDSEGSLRSPHNAYVTIIARMGMPGIILFGAAHLAWAGLMLRCHLQSRAAGEPRWAGLFAALLAYWAAFLVNGAFDVYLEGPMGGIWMWCVFGIGLASGALFKTQPGLLDPLPAGPRLHAPLFREHALLADQPGS